MSTTSDDVEAPAPATADDADGSAWSGPSTPASSMQRLVGIARNLMGTQAATAVLGLLFWTLATRQFLTSSVGIAGAAVSLMSLLASLGTLGLGTVLIARLPLTPQGERRVLVRTSLAVAGVVAAVLAVVVPLVLIHVVGAANLRPVAGSLGPAALFALGTALMAAAMVIDQAVLVVGTGGLQLERNIMASATKVVVLAGLGLLGAGGGMTIFAAWTVGTLVSLPWVAWRSRGGRALADPGPLVDPRALRGLARTALSHHALNTTLQAPLLILPLLVTSLVSAEANGVFTTVVQLTALVFALPFAISISLFAAADGRVETVVANMRRTIPFALVVSLGAYLAVFPLARLLLSVFGPEYADQGVEVLRLLTLAGVPFVVRDHYVALARASGRTTRATLVLAGFLPVELGAAAYGALRGGTDGLVLGWLLVLAVQAVLLAASMRRTVKSRPVLADTDTTTTTASITATPTTQEIALSTTTTAATTTATTTTTTTPTAAALDDSAPATTAAPRTARPVLGPVLVVMALGLLSMAIAARAGREQLTGALPISLWLAGLVLIVVPTAWAVLAPRTSRRDRLVLAVAVPLTLQLSRFVLHPLSFAFHDELIHATVLRQLLERGALFSENSLLPITGYYPGMEVATAAVTTLTGLSQHTAALVVLLAARLVLSLAILALVERITGSSRVAAVASVLYVLNPQYLFFNSQYSYQTFALPMAVLTVYLVLVRDRPAAGSERWAPVRAVALPLAALGTVVVSHHVTTGLLIVALAAWALVQRLRDGASPAGRREARALAGFSAAGVLGLAATVAVPGNTLGSYLGAIGESSAQQVDTLFGGGAAKPLFANSAGISSAPWEQVMIVVSVLVITAVTALALLRARTWWTRRTSVAILLALVALLWPLTPLGHLTRATSEVGDRAAGFSFVGVCDVVAWWLLRRRAHAAGPAEDGVVELGPASDPAAGARTSFGMGGVAALLTAGVVGMVLVGSVIFGAGPLAGQLPGPFRVSADARSVDPYNRAAAAWLDDNVPEGTRVYADRVGGLLTAAEGGTYTVRHISTSIDASRLLLDPDFTDQDVALIRRARIDYVIADRRDANGLPNQDVYVENGEFGGEERRDPVPLAALTKLDGVEGVDRVYDNGALAVYDVRGLRGDR